MLARQNANFGTYTVPQFNEDIVMAERTDSQAIAGIIIPIVIGGLVAWAGSDGGDRFGSLRGFAICAALAFAINWAAYVPAAIARTEHYYDLTGGLTYITVTVVAVWLSASLDLRLGTGLHRTGRRNGYPRDTVWHGDGG